jgi:hypothetical protein
MADRIKKIPGYAVVFVLLLAVAGCGGGSSDSDASGSSAGSGSGGSDGADGGGSGNGDGVAEAPDLDKASSEEQLKLEWSKSEQADAYNLYYATKGDIEPANFQVWMNEHNGEKVAGVTGTSHQVSGLKADTTYHFVITAVDDGEESGPSNEIKATTEDRLRSLSNLNDTGIVKCTDGGLGSAVEDCDKYVTQDADVGRDAAAREGELEKEGGGDGGFDFTKIDAEGNELPASADNWTCVRDNHTGLMWEVKTSSHYKDDGGLRDNEHSYTWYDPDDPTWGSGVKDGGAYCGGHVECNTHSYVKEINDRELCGYSDWRMPSANELHGIMDHSKLYKYKRNGEAIDHDYFPNTRYGRYWSGTPSAQSSNDAWVVWGKNGRERGTTGCGDDARVRVVRDTDSSAAPPELDDIPSAADGCKGDLPPTTPSSEFRVLKEGAVVRHETTNLEWRRCLEGMSWDGSTCKGRPKKMGWEEALKYAENKPGWRMPNINELRSIVERCRMNPAVNQEVFPSTPNVALHSSSPAIIKNHDPRWDTKGAGRWYVAVDKGKAVPGAAGKAIRLVRTAQ